jgi:hypothetical protein
MLRRLLRFLLLLLLAVAAPEGCHQLAARAAAFLLAAAAAAAAAAGVVAAAGCAAAGEVAGLKVCKDGLVVRVWRMRAAIRGRQDIQLGVELVKGDCTGAAALDGAPRLLRSKAGCLQGGAQGEHSVQSHS